MAMTLDLDDTTNCPVGECVGCGGTDTVRAATYDSPMGVFCLTVCAACALARNIPSMALMDAAEAALRHCEHLGIDLDQMAAARERQKNEERQGPHATVHRHPGSRGGV